METFIPCHVEPAFAKLDEPITNVADGFLVCFNFSFNRPINVAHERERERKRKGGGESVRIWMTIAKFSVLTTTIVSRADCSRNRVTIFEAKNTRRCECVLGF